MKKIKPMKILVIEDDIDDCNDLANCAKKRDDIEIVGIKNSNLEGLEYIKLKHPEGIALDIELNNSNCGDLDALDFLSDLKLLNLNYSPIVIVTTHISAKGTYNLLHKSGVNLILYKDNQSYSANYVFNRFISLRQVDYKKNVETIEKILEDNDSKISDYINKELNLIGIPSKMVGRKYIFDAIFYMIKNENSNVNVIRHLSEVYNKAEHTIFNGMQNAISHAWSKTPIDDLLEYYTDPIDSEKCEPRPMEFVYYYRDKTKKMV